MIVRIKELLLHTALNLLDRFGSDEAYLTLMFWCRLKYFPNFRNPKTFNEKLQWLKLYDHNPQYTQYADKYAVREYVRDTIGEQYLIPLLGVYTSADEIDFNSLPDQFVLKCNHGAQLNVICKDKTKLDLEATKRQLNEWLAKDFYRLKREYHYRNIDRRIVCEKYMKDAQAEDLLDYKVFCIGGCVHMIQVDFDRFTKHTRNLYDREWNLLNIEISFPRNLEYNMSPPTVLDNMLECAEKLSRGFPQVRVDFYIINGKLHFGEMTFFSGAGFSKYKPKAFEEEMGRLLVIPIDYTSGRSAR